MTKRFHYAWIIAAVCFFMVFLSLGLCNSPHGLYQVPITSDTGISRSQFASISTIRFLISSLIYFIFGKLCQKTGIRNLAVIGMLTLVAAFFILSIGSKEAVYMFYVGAFFWGFGSALTNNSVASTLVNNWFNKNNGLILGIILAASGVGGSLFSKIVANNIDKFGWRNSYRISTIPIIIAAIVIFIFIKEKPEEKGLLPYGYTGKAEEVSTTEEILTGITVKEAKRTFTFYIILFYSFLAGILTNPVYVSVPAQMSDKGFGEIASTTTSIIFISIAVAKISLGKVRDKFGLALTLCIAFVANISGIILLLTAKSVINYYIFAVIFGFSIPIENLLPPLITKQMFGKKEYTTFIGIVMCLVSLGMGLGNKLMGIFYDTFGSYQLIMSVELVCSIIAFIAIEFAVKKSKKFD